MTEVNGSSSLAPTSLDSGKQASSAVPINLKALTLDLVADYDPLEHLNAIFSHPSTLGSVGRTSKALQTYQNQLDDDIAELVIQQSESDVESVQRIQEAKAELAELFAKVEDVRQRAQETERTITEMTADIKRLDNTKKNLALSMTALKRLQMLTTAYEQLRGLSKTRQYRECAQLLQAVIQLIGHFKSYRSIDQIAMLSRNVSDLQRELLEQVCEDFEITFAKGEIAQKRGMLSEACLVMDALGETARSRLITWYCNTQLREYRQVFRGNDEAGSLDNISRRFSWFRRMLKTYDEEHAAIFPPLWRVNEILATVFCEGTRDDFKSILEKTMRKTDNQTLDVNLMLSCLQETLEFEHSLEKRFSSSSRGSFETLTSSDEKIPAFTQAISEAFEPYFSIWVESQDRQLAGMMPKYRIQPPRSPDEEFTSQSVISSSTELFNFYRVTLAQCAKLSTGIRLVDLSKVFGKYLDQYAQQVLLYHISEKPSGKTPSDSPSIEDFVLVLNTADYCYNTCTQLEEKIKSRVDEQLKSTIDLQSQADAFMGIASASVRGLVRRVEVECEPSWRQMRNTPWNKLDTVGDHSPYVLDLVARVKEKSSDILHLLHKQQYARAFCDNLVELLSNTYLANIVQCRPISEVGAEQMLLDSYVLKSGFTSLLTINEPNTPPPQSYTKRVTNSLSRLDPLLKTIQVRPSPPEALVQAYLIHIADKSDVNFRKILDLKGIRKSEQGHLLELFQAHRAGPQHKDLQPQSPLMSPLPISAGSGSSHTGTVLGPLGSSASLSTATLPTRFDPATLGSVLMSAARDSVDRLGTPSLSGAPNTASTPSGTLSPLLGSGTEHHGTANLNENLRNIGKFFKRDLGSFSGRFSKGGATAD
ncbi:MAG: Vacuolar protein sorting-associated protein 53 [Cirrosporium novae-zelandiae]|nr:MAG: Vacuolar protein sorting-associated protein 53 [Cirrosporium novae-zelandiae]